MGKEFWVGKPPSRARYEMDKLPTLPGTTAWKEEQRGLAEQLRARAAGEVPSAAEMQMRRGLGAAQRGARAQAASATGLGPALQARMAGQAQESMAMQTGQQTAILRAQEQAAAEQAYAEMLAGARGQDVQQQQFEQQTALQEYLGRHGIIAGQPMVGGHPGFAGYMSQAAGAALGHLSDEREKTDIKPLSGKQIDSFMEALKGYNYKYKKSADNMVPGDKKDKKQAGVMAQALAKTDIGKSVVRKIDATEFVPMKPKKGKKKERLVIDNSALSAALAASVGSLHQKIKDLEKKKKG